MKINDTYKKLNINQKINTRSQIMIDRRTGLTPNTKKGRFDTQLDKKHSYIDFFGQPFYLRKHVISDIKYINQFDIKF